MTTPTLTEGESFPPPTDRNSRKALFSALLPRIQTAVGLLALALLAVGLYQTFTVAPDFQQGDTVRIMYIHVPSAKLALLCYLVLTVASIIHLWKRSEKADLIAEAAAPVGAAASAVTLATGSIWGKPMWGAWWAWDARLTSMLVLLILYIGLMALRNAFEDRNRASRPVAIMAIFGAVDLPIIHYSVTWWRTLHQPSSFEGRATPAITGELLTPLLTMSLAFVVLGAYFIILRARTVSLRRRLDALEEELDHA